MEAFAESECADTSRIDLDLESGNRRKGRHSLCVIAISSGGGKRPPSATSSASFYAGMIGKKDEREGIGTSTTNFMLSMYSNNRQFQGVLDLRGTLQPVHVFGYKAFCPL
ncbi:uncharacterized protein [Montipora foliosa]|uniref:uncharacterized protein n=1 Tax=Montipora foliosa TaxID=591990 RepID=UPI0035F16A6C